MGLRMEGRSCEDRIRWAWEIAGLVVAEGGGAELYSCRWTIPVPFWRVGVVALISRDPGDAGVAVNCCWATPE
jgi:hypothetical protein